MGWLQRSSFDSRGCSEDRVGSDDGTSPLIVNYNIFLVAVTKYIKTKHETDSVNNLTALP